MKLHLFAALLFAAYSANQACAQSMSDRTQVQKPKHFEKSFLDSKENVHIVYSSGEDVQITRDGRCEDLKVDQNEQIVGWVHRGTVEDERGRVIEEFRRQYQEGTNVVLLDPDVAEVFPTEDSVNRALRSLIDVAQRSAALRSRSTGRSKKRRAG